MKKILTMIILLVSTASYANVDLNEQEQDHAISACNHRLDITKDYVNRYTTNGDDLEKTLPHIINKLETNIKEGKVSETKYYRTSTWESVNLSINAVEFPYYVKVQKFYVCYFNLQDMNANGKLVRKWKRYAKEGGLID
jgi:hypothetical protein